MFWLRNKKIIFSYTLLSGGLINSCKHMTLSNQMYCYISKCIEIILCTKDTILEWNNSRMVVVVVVVVGGGGGGGGGSLPAG